MTAAMVMMRAAMDQFFFLDMKDEVRKPDNGGLTKTTALLFGACLWVSVWVLLFLLFFRLPGKLLLLVSFQIPLEFPLPLCYKEACQEVHSRGTKSRKQDAETPE